MKTKYEYGSVIVREHGLSFDDIYTIAQIDRVLRDYADEGWEYMNSAPYISQFTKSSNIVLFFRRLRQNDR